MHSRDSSPILTGSSVLIWTFWRPAIAALVVWWVAAGAAASTSNDVQVRIDADIAAEKPIVIHLVVALCDNIHQGIVPVPKALGDGQNPRTNLYWGALYGVRTHLPRSSGWTRLDVGRPADERPILDRIVLYTQIERHRRSVPVYLVADAWDGASIRKATRFYFEIAAGRSVENIPVEHGARSIALQAGGAAHLAAYVGHNGLMDFSLDPPAAPAKESPARSAVALACASKQYFADRLRSSGAHPLLLTTGLMAPEAYTLDAAIRSWVAEGTTAAVIESAAGAYHRYQKCGLNAARRLFWGQP